VICQHERNKRTCDIVHATEAEECALRNIFNTTEEIKCSCVSATSSGNGNGEGHRTFGRVSKSHLFFGAPAKRDG
jgi:hypothetical protein